jgi:hypothetical protein
VAGADLRFARPVGAIGTCGINGSRSSGARVSSERHRGRVGRSLLARSNRPEMPPIGRLCLCTARKSLRSRWVAGPAARPVDLRDTYFHRRRSESGWACDLAQTGAGHPPRPRVRAARGGRQSPAKRRRESGRRGCSTAARPEAARAAQSEIELLKGPSPKNRRNCRDRHLAKTYSSLARALDLRHHRRWVRRGSKRLVHNRVTQAQTASWRIRLRVRSRSLA